MCVYEHKDVALVKWGVIIDDRTLALLLIKRNKTINNQEESVETKPRKRENKPGFFPMPLEGILLEGMNDDSLFVGNNFCFINDLSMMGEKNYLVSG